jgi:hypothetical protein
MNLVTTVAENLRCPQCNRTSLSPSFWVAASSRLRTSLDVDRFVKAYVYRHFALFLRRRWMLVEVFGGGKWWAVVDSDCPANFNPHKT